MPQTEQEIESQIFILEKLLAKTPEVLGFGLNGKKQYNPRFFSLKGKIKNLKIELNNIKNPTGQDAWNQYLSK